MRDAYGKSGKNVEAEKALKSLLDTPGGKIDYPRIVKELVKIAGKMNRIDALQKEAEEKLKKFPEDATSLAILARIYRIYRKDIDRTIDLLEKLRKSEPHNMFFIAELYTAYDIAGRTEDCEKLLKGYRVSSPMSASLIYLTIAEACLESSRVASAKACIEKYAGEATTHPGRVYLMAGKLFQEFELMDEALDYLKKAVGKAQNDAERDGFELETARCLVAFKKYGEAEQMLTAIQKRVKPHSAIMYKIKLLQAEIARAVVE